MEFSAKQQNKPGAMQVVLRVLVIILETVLLALAAVYLVLFIHFKGPSRVFGEKLARTLQESSALKFVPNLFYSEAEMNEIMAYKESVYTPPTDTSLISIPQEAGEAEKVGEADRWGLIDEDGDGLILQEVHGSGYSGYMMIVLDPSRVIMGSVPSSFGKTGYTVAQMVEYYNAVVGINAGGFQDIGGQGDGSTPDSLVVFEGQIYYEANGIGSGFVGLDSNNILHVGLKSVQEIKNADIQYGVCFGPVLVINGEMADESSLQSGTNPRTAIGQRSDGAILMLVIDGRQQISIGASYVDVAEVMLRYGAVNACNLDGGSSTLMWYNGDYINNCASVVGIRPVPSTFLVLPKEG